MATGRAPAVTGSVTTGRAPAVTASAATGSVATAPAATAPVATASAAAIPAPPVAAAPQPTPPGALQPSAPPARGRSTPLAAILAGAALLGGAGLAWWLSARSPSAPPAGAHLGPPAVTAAASPPATGATRAAALPPPTTPPTSEPAPAASAAPPVSPAASVDPGAAAEAPPGAFEPILFGYRSAALSRGSGGALRDLARRASACPGRIAVTGHTCDMGSAAANRALGLTRAAHVKMLLVSNGIDGDRIVIHSAGALEPAVPNTSEEARARNRRVTLACEPKSH